jgi:LmbE family N-acetylglucosaminyl deacetylase
MNIIAIGSHPDDIEYGCGGTLMRHIKRGDKVTFVVMSRGEKGGDPDLRHKEAREAAKKIGADIRIFDYPDADIPQGHEIIDRLEKLISDIKPQRVYTHSVKDTHQDHRNVAYVSIAAARFVPEILAYESPSLYLMFTPNYYVDISNYIDEKIELLNCFSSQNGKDYMKINAIRGLSQFRGLAPNVSHAEAFEVIRILKPDGV